MFKIHSTVMECQVMEFQENSHRGRIFENVTSILQKKRILKGFILPLGNAFLAISFLVFMAIKLFIFTITWHRCLISEKVTHDHARERCTFSTHHIIRFKLRSNHHRLILVSNRQATLKVSKYYVYRFLEG